jgi:hypothetical protein
MKCQSNLKIPFSNITQPEKRYTSHKKFYMVFTELYIIN